MKEAFRRFADRTSVVAGSPWLFAGTVVLTLIWLGVGPATHFSDTWQLTMNTFASQLTFLMAFLLQNTQNRETRALHLKLDDLLRSAEGARKNLVNLEALPEEELDRLQKEFERLGHQRQFERLSEPVSG